jgi:hypothetical protein
MAGPGSFPLALPLTRAAESSRLQLDLVRRAFEFLVPHRQHPLAQLQHRHGARRPQWSAATARRGVVAGG